MKLTNREKASMIDTLDFLRVEAAQYRLEGVDDLPAEHLKNIKKIEDCILLAELSGPSEEERKEIWQLMSRLAEWRILLRDRGLWPHKDEIALAGIYGIILGHAGEEEKEGDNG